jgi:hypothetical protein
MRVFKNTGITLLGNNLTKLKKRNKMKKLIKITFVSIPLFALTTIISCKKEKPVTGCTNASALNYNSNAVEDDGSCQYNGNVIFWFGLAATQATVTINGQTGFISTFYVLAPGCGASGCANFTLPTGSYTYTAQNLLRTWNGTVTITKNGCASMLLQ